MKNLKKINRPILLLVKDKIFDVPSMLRILWPDGTLIFSMVNNDEAFYMNDTGQMEYSQNSSGNLSVTIKKMNKMDKKSGLEVVKIINL